MRDPTLLSLLVLGLCLLPHAVALSALNATVVDGLLSIPTLNVSRTIPFTFSALQGVVTTYFAAVTPPDARNGSALLNSISGFFSYLSVTHGDWSVDAPLSLLPQLVLLLDDVVITPTPEFADARSWGGIIELNASHYAAVASPTRTARFVCNNASAAPAAVKSTESEHIVIDGLSVVGCGKTEGGGLHVQGTPRVWGPTHVGGTIANCNVSFSSRGIWLEQMIRMSIVNNTLYMNHDHTLDFDAFTTDCVASGNHISDSREEAIFIEQGSSGHIIAGNVLGPNNSAGVAIYNNDMNITCGPHVIVANEIFGNREGVGVGSTAPRSGTADNGNRIIGNHIHDNGVGDKPQGVHTNGAQVGTEYAANDNADGVSAFTQKFFQPNISFVDPLDHEIPLKY